MKVATDTAARLAPATAAVILDQDTVTRALKWADAGWPTFALARRSKMPAIPNAHPDGDPLRGKCKGQCGRFGHGVHDASRDPSKIRVMFEGHPGAGIGGATTDRLVIDIDLQSGGYEVDVLPPTRTHLTGRGNGNTHRIYRLGRSELAQQIKSGKIITGVDIKTGPGSYIAMPGTKHPDTGGEYTVLDDQPEHFITDDEIRAIWSAYGAKLPGERIEQAGTVPPSPSRDLFNGSGHFGPSKVLEALRDPSSESGRNVQFATVVGHYARTYRDDYEMFAYHADVFAARQVPPMDTAEIEKVKRSIWDAEHSKEGERAWAVAQRVESKLIEHEAKGEFARTLAALDPAEPFDAGSLGEVLQRPDTTRFRVAELILSEGFTTVVAARKTGKTTFNLNLAHSLITGSDFLGRFPVDPVTGRVAILNFEVAAKQVAHWANLIGLDHDKLEIITLRGRRNPLLVPQDRAELAKYLRDRSVEFMFVDPFSRAFYGDNGNDNTQVQAFLNDLDVFARSEAGIKDVVLNVHAGWNGDRSRGASALEDHPDSIIWLRGGDRTEGDKSSYVAALGRDVDLDEVQLAFDPETYRLSLTGEGSRRDVKQQQKSADLEPRILALVADEPGIKSGAITESLRAVKARFQKGDETRTLKAMFEAGRIGWAKGDGNSSRWYPAGHPDAETKSPLSGMTEVGF
ncbi:AAA family ATPase [Microbacterium rhizomatis]|uniref:AAA family ATPase n=1 Tax=Microbacterium rhizomatis TaxID=1631477 RepID=A0A5J5J5X3_9MICO|nr:AAA family ATPase [Microbacterium rhizomatis]KAA9110375.1 AAA family ATPase [Microbacterium rhizomatis]